LYDDYYQILRGKFHYLGGNYDSALYYVGNAIQLRKYHANHYAERANIHIARGDYIRALKDLRQAYGLDNSNKHIISLLAKTYAELGHHDSCIFYAGKRLAIDSMYWPTYYQMAKSFAMKNNMDSVIKYYNGLARFESENKIYLEYMEEISGLIDSLKGRK